MRESFKPQMSILFQSTPQRWHHTFHVVWSHVICITWYKIKTGRFGGEVSVISEIFDCWTFKLIQEHSWLFTINRIQIFVYKNFLDLFLICIWLFLHPNRILIVFFRSVEPTYFFLEILYHRILTSQSGRSKEAKLDAEMAESAHSWNQKWRLQTLELKGVQMVHLKWCKRDGFKNKANWTVKRLKLDGAFNWKWTLF